MAKQTSTPNFRFLFRNEEAQNQLVAPGDTLPVTVEFTPADNVPSRDWTLTLEAKTDQDISIFPSSNDTRDDGKIVSSTIFLTFPKTSNPTPIEIIAIATPSDGNPISRSRPVYLVNGLYEALQVTQIDDATRDDLGLPAGGAYVRLRHPGFAGGFKAFDLQPAWTDPNHRPVDLVNPAVETDDFFMPAPAKPVQVTLSLTREVKILGAGKRAEPLYFRGDSLFAASAWIEPPRASQPPDPVVRVALQRTGAVMTRDAIVNNAIRASAQAMSSGRYFQFIDRVFCGEHPQPPHLMELRQQARHPHAFVGGVNAYEMLKTATQVFLLTHCGVARDPDAFRDTAEEDGSRLGEYVSPEELSSRITSYLDLSSGRLPYIQRIIDTAFADREGTSRGLLCHGLIAARIDAPCLVELIWSYWHEEGMLVQTLNAISRRFQNVRAPGGRDPLAHLEIDPLRPLNGVLWGYIQDEWNRLSVQRRAYEYDHQYGLPIYGRAVPGLRPADSRSKFLEAFHNLLHRTYVFYKEDSDTTVIADGYPLLNSLKEVHLLLAQGAHNQFGDLPWTARVEMLMQQWILARPEMRDFLQSRPMVPYTERWMPAVDTMKTLQGWSDVTVTHFRDLGVYGEQVLLSVRWNDWIGINDENAAKNWARYWRPEIQSYIHAYRAVTGADLSNPEGVDVTPPSWHLRKRLALQRAR
ncbi:hypothetical protein [Methylobacterium sp. SyP6R]|uniref:hypothetical protein n=1 Tax=Methylobacterium sp. SyP6R TaxID=2718876 RepID=UPI001F426EA7|nr:hypothetical protein [Methylobacterium sp. SyP6R]MCF4129941.1 hypothetical protein [Methylobacterium sp. SyP6R]